MIHELQSLIGEPSPIVPWPWDDRGRSRLVETPEQIRALRYEVKAASEMYGAAMRGRLAEFLTKEPH